MVPAIACGVAVSDRTAVVGWVAAEFVGGFVGIGAQAATNSAMSINKRAILTILLSNYPVN